jgi:hypothetical protein
MEVKNVTMLKRLQRPVKTEEEERRLNVVTFVPFLTF